MIRLVDTVRYDRPGGAVTLLEWRGQGAPAHTALADEQGVADALARGASADADEAAYLAALGLALAARAWQGRPTDARRGALIQAAERLGATLPPAARTVLSRARAAADAAILAGRDAEEALLTLAQEYARLADRAAERCGRHAEGLLDDEDGILALPIGGRALLWTLRLAAGQGRRLRLSIPEELADTPGSRRLAARAGEIGVTLAEIAGGEALTVCLAETGRAALDGGVELAPGALSLATAARQAMPLYAMAPEGPDPAAESSASLTGDAASPALISAVVTSRGTYRPAMLARYLDDGDAPLDVIPLM
ncbi:MAG: hypothetical protein RLZZ387_2194 [Chloroflexota bacterium]